jgi:hypothetical protein
VTRTAATLLVITGLPALAGGWQLTWAQGPGAGSCADGSTLEHAVETKLGMSIFASTGRPDWKLDGAVRRTSGAWEAEVNLRSPNGTLVGTRHHRSEQPECTELSEALVLIIALMVETAPQPEPTPPPMAPGLRRPLEARRPAGPTRPESSFEAHLGIFPLIGLGMRSGPAFGARVQGMLVLKGPLGFEVGAETWFPTQFTSGAHSFAVAQLAMRTGACISAHPLARLQAATCAGLLAGIYQLTSGDLPPPFQPFSPLLDAGLRGQLSLAVTSVLELSAGVGAGVRLIRPRFGYVDANGAPVALFSAAPLTLDLGIGLSLSL